AADLGSPDRLGDVVALQQHAVFARKGELELGTIEEAPETFVVFPIDARALGSERDGSVDGTGIDDGESQPSRQLARDRALSRAGGTVDGDDGRHPRVSSACRAGQQHGSGAWSVAGWTCLSDLAMQDNENAEA